MPDGGASVVAWLVSAAEAVGADALAVNMAMNAATWATALQVTAAVYTLRDQQRRAENRARDQYNASQRDRYVMTRGATEPRQLVLGRQRVSGPIDPHSYGTNKANLVFNVILQADELDAVEAVYFDDEPVVLSGTSVVGIRRRDEFSISAATGTFTISSKPKAGTVAAVASYGSTDVTLGVSVSDLDVSVTGAHSGETGLLTITYQPDPCPYALEDGGSAYYNFTPSGTGTDVVTLPVDVVADSVSAVETWSGGDAQSSATRSCSVAGRVVTVIGATGGGSIVTVSYQELSAPSRATVRVHLGAAGQTADATMIANLGGVWTSAHTGTGIAYLSVDLAYDQDAFSNGMPNVSAVVRGLKCYDPRDGGTRWTENPALLMRAYAIHPLGGRLPTSAIDDNSIIAAANVCDASTTYTVGGKTYTRARYTAGTVARAGMRPADVLNDLAQAMGGRWCMVDGKLRVWAGAYTSPVLSLDESWLHEGGGIQIQPSRSRADVINAITGTFADSTKDYKVLAFPKVSAAAYITEDGRELPSDTPMPAVTWAGQAQYIAACQLRYARQGLTVKLTCNMRAYQAEPFDVCSVSLARYGWVAKPFEVLDTSFTPDGGIELTLKETDASIWDMDADFTATDPAPNTRLASPWDLPMVTGLALSSGTAALLKQADGTITPRILAEWDAQTDPRIAQDGKIELRWGPVGAPEPQWQSRVVAGSATQEYLTGVSEGVVYLVKARTVGSLANGRWCTQVAELVLGKSQPPSTPTGLTAAVVKGVITWTWDACTDVDYAATEVRAADAAWGTAAPEAHFRGAANGWQEITLTTGDITRHIRHFDTSGNFSVASDSYTITVTDADLGDQPTLTATPETLQVPVDSAGTADFSAAVSQLAVMLSGADQIADWTIGKTDHGVTSTLSGAHDETLTITGYDPAQVSATYRAVVLQCHLDGNASDSSQYHRTAAVGSGVTFGAGVFGQAAHFPGGNGAACKMRFQSPDLRLRGAFSIRFRVKFNSYPSWSEYYFCGNSYNGFRFGKNGSGIGYINWQGFVSAAGAGALTIGTNPAITPISTGVFYAIEVSRDNGGNIRMFVDGALVSGPSNYPADPKASFDGIDIFDVGFGDNELSYTVGLDGVVDELQVLIGDPGNAAAYTPAAAPFADSDRLTLGSVDVTATRGAVTLTRTVQVLSTAVGEPAIAASLSPAAWVAPASATGVVPSFAGSATTWKVLAGIVDDSDDWSAAISATSSASVAGSVSGRTLTVTTFSAAVDSGWIDIALTRTGYATQVLRYVLSKAKAADLYAISWTANTIYVPADWQGVASGLPLSSTVSLRRNDVDESTSYTVGVTPVAGVTTSITGRTVSVTALADGVDSVTLLVALTRAGWPTQYTGLAIQKQRAVKPAATWRGTSSVVIAAQLNGHVPSSSLAGANGQCWMSPFVGDTDETALWTYSHSLGAGLTVTRTDNVVQLTAMADGTDESWVDITASKTGWADITARTLVTKAKTLPITGPVSWAVVDSTVRAYNTPIAATLRIRTDGALLAEDGLFAVQRGLWYSPLTAGAGTSPGYWVRMTIVSGTTPTGMTAGTWYALTSDRTVSITPAAGASVQSVLLMEISSDSGGSTIVASGQVALNSVCEVI